MLERVDKDFWCGKRVLLTGHTGFKGSWLSLWLSELGANVRGISLEPDGTRSMFALANIEPLLQHYVDDIRDYDRLKYHIEEFDPQILLHLAAQPLVRSSYEDPVKTYEINVIGTVKILEAARYGKSLKAIVNVTTDKCYENNEWAWGYREIEPMGGHDPYSSSKGCAELVTSAYRRSFLMEAGINVATARAGNVIGGGDWSADRLLPDIVKSISDENEVVIRNPDAIRPWQHVLEPLHGYLILAQNLCQEQGQKYADAWNFGPNEADARSVKWIVKEACRLWSPNAKWRVELDQQLHEANNLKLDISKAKLLLGWKPRWQIDYALDLTIAWYKMCMLGADLKQISLEQIRKYQAHK